MRPIRTASSNHLFGAPAGMEQVIGDLPCEVVETGVGVDGNGVIGATREVRSVWQLDEGELVALLNGQNVGLAVMWIGAFPPVALGVIDEQPEGEERPRWAGTFRQLAKVFAERCRQEAKCEEKRWRTCADPFLADGEKLAVLVEEVGEVAREICDARAEHREPSPNLQVELVQVAAIAVAWAESLASRTLPSEVEFPIASAESSVG